MHLIELRPDSKKPKGAHFNISENPEEHARWLKEGNVGYHAGLNNSVILDFDILFTAKLFYMAYKHLLGPIVISPRKGIHAYFQGETRPRKLVFDGKACGEIRAGNTYCVFPPSKVGKEYVFAKGHEWKEPLPPFPAELFPDKQKETTGKVIEECDTLRRITRARAWLATIEPAISGQGGHNVMFRACCKMSQMFGLSMSEAWPLILEFNERCQPPFTDRELRHKIESAFSRKGE